MFGVFQQNHDVGHVLQKRYQFGVGHIFHCRPNEQLSAFRALPETVDQFDNVGNRVIETELRSSG